MLDFKEQRSVPRSTYIISESLPIYNVSTNAFVEVIDCEYSINDGDWLTIPTQVMGGENIRLRILSSSLNNTSYTGHVTVGANSGTFIITTIEIDDIPDYVWTEYLDVARNRYTEFFKEDIVFDKYNQLIVTQCDVVQQCLKDMMQRRWLKTASGDQLDNIGEIVGQPRDLFDSVIIYYFGYVGASGAMSYGTVSNPLIGGRYKSVNDPFFGSRYLNNDEYRTLINIKILKNSTKGLINEFVEMARLLFNVTDVTYTESDGTITINIGRDYNDPDLSFFKGLDEIQLAERYLPLPIGIRLEFDGTIL